jgi:hypothetical protein
MPGMIQRTSDYNIETQREKDLSRYVSSNSRNAAAKQTIGYHRTSLVKKRNGSLHQKTNEEGSGLPVINNF